MAAGDKRELVLDLLARDKTGDGTKSASKNIKGVGDAADKAGTQLGGLGRQSKKAEDAADELGDEAQDVGRQLAKLDAEIKLAEHELKGLARAFADTDDAAQKLDIAKVQRKLQRDIANATKNKNILKDILPDPEPKDTRPIAGKIMSGIASGFKDAAGPLKGSFITALGAGLAPEIAGLMAAAVVGGIGLGGILGGVALAAKNPQIQASAEQIGTRFMTGITGEAQGAFLNPLQKSLDLVGQEADKAVPKIGKLFQNLAPMLVPLTKDILGAGDALLDSFVYASARAEPVLRSLGGATRSLAGDASSFIEEMADHSEESARAVDYLASSVHLLLAGLTPLVGALASVYGGLGKLSDWAHSVPVLGNALDGLKTSLFGPIGMLGDLATKAGWVKKATEDVKPPTVELTEAQKALQQEFDDTTRAAQGEQSALDELATALKAQTDPVFALLSAQDKLAAAQKNVSKATKDHGRNSTEAKQALRDLAEAALEAEGAAGQLGSEFNGHMTPALEATLISAGLTKGEIDRLKSQFEQAKKAGNQFAKNYKANLQVTGTETSASKINHVKTLLAQVRNKTVRVEVLVNQSRLDKVNDQLERVRGHATGGSVSRDTPFWAGEAGPELVWPDANARVMSASASRGAAAMAGPARGGVAAAGGTVRLELVGQQEIVSAFRYLIRTANLIQ